MTLYCRGYKDVSPDPIITGKGETLKVIKRVVLKIRINK